MPLDTQDFTTLVRNQIAAIQGRSTQLLDFSTGSVLLALIEANTAAVALWLQGLASYDLSLARATTSNETDLDSWMADFGLVRNPSTFATGIVTFSRVDTTLQALIPIDTQLQTSNGVVKFTVTVDTDNANYNAALNGYVMNVGIGSIDVPVIANEAGTVGNIGVNTLTIFNTPISYVDTVSNGASFTNALDAESDAAFRSRFILFLASLSKATLAAIQYAVQSVTGVTNYKITENEDYAGATKLGYFYVVIDDGTGVPSAQLISNVNNAVDAVRGLSIQFGVFAVVVSTITVAMTVTVNTGYSHAVIAPIVQSAISAFINTLPIGEDLLYTRLIQVAYDSSPGVYAVSAYTLNGGTSDIAINTKTVAKSGTITIN